VFWALLLSSSIFVILEEQESLKKKESGTPKASFSTLSCSSKKTIKHSQLYDTFENVMDLI
jgi:hypothetical protein